MRHLPNIRHPTPTAVFTSPYVGSQAAITNCSSISATEQSLIRPGVEIVVPSSWLLLSPGASTPTGTLLAVLGRAWQRQVFAPEVQPIAAQRTLTLTAPASQRVTTMVDWDSKDLRNHSRVTLVRDKYNCSSTMSILPVPRMVFECQHYGRFVADLEFPAPN